MEVFITMKMIKIKVIFIIHFLAIILVTLIIAIAGIIGFMPKEEDEHIKESLRLLEKKDELKTDIFDIKFKEIDYVYTAKETSLSEIYSLSEKIYEKIESIKKENKNIEEIENKIDGYINNLNILSKSVKELSETNKKLLVEIEKLKTITLETAPGNIEINKYTLDILEIDKNLKTEKDSIKFYKEIKNFKQKVLENSNSESLKKISTENIYKQSAYLESLAENILKNEDLIKNSRKNSDKIIKEILFNIRISENNIILEKADTKKINIIYLSLFLVIVFLYILLFRSINMVLKPLKDMILSFDKGEKGDLTTRVVNNSKGEIGFIVIKYNNFMEKIENIISDIGMFSHRVAVFATELSAGMKSLAKGASEESDEIKIIQNNMKDIEKHMTEISHNIQEQMASIEETSSSMEEVSQSAMVAVKNAETTKRLANEATIEAEEGNNLTLKVLNGMNNIKDVTTSINGKVYELGEKTVKEIEMKAIKLGESSEEIGNILKVMEEISEQTNMLALNAAIEAAHAGDAGKGFSVVADEIKLLAERSHKSAKEIEKIIRAIQKDVGNVIVGTKGGYDALKKIIEETKQGEREVNYGIQLAKDTQKKLSNIEKKIKDTTDQINSITNAMEEQAYAMEETTKAITNIAESSAIIDNHISNQMGMISEIVNSIDLIINEVIDGTNIATNEAAAATEELSAIAEALNNMVQEFKVKEKKIIEKKSVEEV